MVVLKVKCPHSKAETAACTITPNDCLTDHEPNFPFCPSSLKSTHRHYSQVQGQFNLHPLAEYCDFVVWTPRSTHTERIQKDMKHMILGFMSRWDTCALNVELYTWKSLKMVLPFFTYYPHMYTFMFPGPVQAIQVHLNTILLWRQIGKHRINR